jgi:hypothetical protein
LQGFETTVQHGFRLAYALVVNKLSLISVCMDIEELY